MLNQLKKTDHASLIPFLMAGHPNLETTERLANALIEEGAAAIELGVPFSDALADGPVIQLAAESALKHNVSLDDVIALAARITKRNPNVPIIIFSYLNPILQLGLKTYVTRAKEAGVAATLTVDLPPEEAEEYCDVHRRLGLGTVFLASPISSRKRLPLIVSLSTAFLYVVSRTGVTGVQQSISTTLGEEVRRLREFTDLPLAVGFGISTGAQAREVGKFADAVVVGSAFVKMIEAQSHDPNRVEDAVRSLAKELVAGLRIAYADKDI